jgi:hypothetical protein
VSPGAVFGLVLAAGAVAFILAPLIRGESEVERKRSTVDSVLQDLEARHEMALGALKDLEDDRQTGKIDDLDYRELKAKLTAEAVEIMKQLDAHPTDSKSSPRDRRADVP